MIDATGDFCSVSCRDIWHEEKNAQYQMQRSKPTPVPETIPNLIVKPTEAPTGSPTESDEHDPNTVDYGDGSEDEHIPVPRVECNNCNHWTPAESTICENCQKHIGKQRGDPKMREHLDAIMQGSSIKVEHANAMTDDQRGVNTTLRYHAIPIELRQQRKSSTPLKTRTADAKNKWRKYVRDDPRYSTLVEWYDDLPDEPHHPGDQLCKAYWLGAKSEVKDRDFWADGDNLMGNISYKPMSQSARDEKFRDRKIVKYDEATLTMNRKLYVDAGLKPHEPSAHKHNPESVALQNEWLEERKRRKQQRASERAQTSRPASGWEERWNHPKNWSSDKATWTQRQWSAAPYSGRSDWKSEPAGSGGANPSGDVRLRSVNREQRGSASTQPPWRQEAEQPEESSSSEDVPWGDLV